MTAEKAGGKVQPVLEVRYAKHLKYAASETFTHDNVTNGTSYLKIQFRPKCDEHYYGPTCRWKDVVLCVLRALFLLCSTYCQRGIGFGHYKCGDNGTKICDRGWDGDNCEKGAFIRCFGSSERAFLVYKTPGQLMHTSFVGHASFTTGALLSICCRQVAFWRSF